MGHYAAMKRCASNQHSHKQGERSHINVQYNLMTVSLLLSLSLTVGKQDIYFGNIQTDVESRFVFSRNQDSTYMIRNKILTKKAEEKTLITHRHLLNAFSEPPPRRTLELTEAIKS